MELARICGNAYLSIKYDGSEWYLSSVLPVHSSVWRPHLHITRERAGQLLLKRTFERFGENPYLK